jgi:hypothetical protein
VCTGYQVANVLACISRVHGPLLWYAADVRAPGPLFKSAWRSPCPERVGSDRDILQRAQAVGQFESGVFVAVPASVLNPRFREGGLHTKDGVDADLADSVVEVRAFDKMFVEVISTDETVLAELSRTFGVPVGLVAS